MRVRISLQPIYVFVLVKNSVRNHDIFVYSCNFSEDDSDIVIYIN